MDSPCKRRKQDKIHKSRHMMIPVCTKELERDRRSMRERARTAGAKKRKAVPSGAWTGQALTKSKRRSLGQIKGRRPEAERERKRASWAEAEEAAKRRKRKRCESFDETVMPFVAGL